MFTKYGIHGLNALSDLFGQRKTNSMSPKIVDGIVFAEEDIPCKTISKRDTHQNQNLPIIHKGPPGKFISMPVKAEMHVP